MLTLSYLTIENDRRNNSESKLRLIAPETICRYDSSTIDRRTNSNIDRFEKVSQQDADTILFNS